MAGMRGRPAEFDPDTATDAAMRVFWSQGYAATSISDLLAATSLSRSSLYQTYSSKEGLFRHCLDRYCEDLAAQLRDGLDSARSARAFVEETFLQVARHADNVTVRQGCLAMNTAIELGHTDSPLARHVHRSLQRFARVFSDAVRRAQREGTISADKKPADLGHYLVSSMCGLRMLIKCGASPAEAGRVATIMLRALD